LENERAIVEDVKRTIMTITMIADHKKQMVRDGETPFIGAVTLFFSSFLTFNN